MRDGVIVEIVALAGVCVGVGSAVDSGAEMSVGVDSLVGEWIGGKVVKADCASR